MSEQHEPAKSEPAGPGPETDPVEPPPNADSDIDSKVFDKASRRLRNPHHSSDEQKFEEIRHLKQQEERASRARMQELIDIETARQNTLRRQLARKKKRDQQLLMFSLGIIIAFVLLVVIYTVIVSITG